MKDYICCVPIQNDMEKSCYKMHLANPVAVVFKSPISQEGIDELIQVLNADTNFENLRCDAKILG